LRNEGGGGDAPKFGLNNTAYSAAMHIPHNNTQIRFDGIEWGGIDWGTDHSTII